MMQNINTPLHSKTQRCLLESARTSQLPRQPRKAPKRLALRGLFLGVACLAVSACAGLAGCSRAFYRQDADIDGVKRILEKADHPHWDLQRYHLQPDPTSRMAPFGNPDRPPMPPDDPAAHRLMHVVDNKPGYPFWDVNGHTQFIENPDWKAFLPLDEEGVLTLSSEQSVKLAIVHSTDYQQQMESLYLSALDVTAERFAYDTQLFGGYSAQYDALGRLAPAAGGQSQSLLDLSTRNISANRFFTTGASLVVGLANTLIWQFSGTDSHTASTLVNFSLVQPLLRGAGRDKIMETLTLSERALLANVRQMERYQRGFYLDLITGTGDQPGPRRRGGVFGASGLRGFTGVGSGGFGGIGGGIFTRGGGDGAGSGQAGGYLGLLQTQQNIRNQEANIAALRSSLWQLEAMRAASRIDFFQVEQIRQQLFQSTSVLLTSKRGYQDSLDRFKRQLGLPPKINVRIQDPALDQFKLIAPEILELQQQASDLQRQAGQTNLAILDLLEKAAGDLNWSDALAKRLREARQHLMRLQELRKQVRTEITIQIRKEIDQLRIALPNRRKHAQRMRRAIREAADSFDSLLRDADPQLFDLRDIEQLPDQLAQQLRDVDQRLVEDHTDTDKILQSIDRLLKAGDATPGKQLQQDLQTQVLAPTPHQVTEFGANLLELSLMGARARAESITLQPIDIDAPTAVEIARAFRRDWMNARASLVDAWRLIEFNADDLESVLDIVFTGDIRNEGDNPLRLRDAAGSLGVGFRFDAPLTRLLERNLYRQSLIEYEQARRAFYQVEDSISQALRAILRQVELHKINFELRRTALRVAVAQVQSARLRLQEPPALGATETSLGPTTALNLLNALDSLRDAQDDFLSVWVNYQIQRGQLDLQMGTMQLNREGGWIDPGPIGPEHNYPSLDDWARLAQGCPNFPDLGFLIPEGALPPEAAAEGEQVPTPAPQPDGPNVPLTPPRQGSPLPAPGSAEGRPEALESNRSIGAEEDDPPPPPLRQPTAGEPFRDTQAANRPASVGGPVREAIPFDTGALEPPRRSSRRRKQSPRATRNSPPPAGFTFPTAIRRRYRR